MKNLLVLGGSGLVGRALCALWAKQGAPGCLVVPSRRCARARPLQILPGLELRDADVHDDAQLARLVAGCGAVVNLVGILHGDAAAFERAHVALPRRLATACAVAGVRRIVHVSALGAAAQAPSIYLRTKAAAESALRHSGVAATILRPSVIFGAEDNFLNMFARLQAVFPVIPLACATARFQPVWVNDVAAAIVRVLEDAGTANLTLDCAGPRVYSLRELVRLAGRWSGHERPVLALPDALARFQAVLLERLPGEPLLSRDNLRSMRVASIASGQQPGLEQIGIEPTPIEAIGPGMFTSSGEAARLNRWRGIGRGG